MGALGRGLNKALLPLGQEAVISRIIARFPRDTRFVIALGYLGEQVRAYLDAAHPEGHFEFVVVDRYDGPGSGPGYSLSRCEALLQCPFFFVSCDTLWEGKVPLHAEVNWFGTARVPLEETRNYCNFGTTPALPGGERRIVGIFDKTAAPEGAEAFTGLCYIRDHALFWPALGEDTLVQGERQISNGIQALVASGRASALTVEWTDLGTESRFLQAAARYQDYDFSKTGEFLYILNGRVIKFFENSEIVKKRVTRARLNPAVFPPIATCQGQFYSYDFVPGRTLYEHNSVEVFSTLLSWLKKNLWKTEAPVDSHFHARAEAFYKTKTLERLSAYHLKYPGTDIPSVVNGAQTPAVSALLERVSWQKLLQGKPAFFHGDLQFDNILYAAETGSFVLLDWRQDFGGDVQMGDQYYDLAKLNGGILLSYDFIKKGLFTYLQEGNSITLDFASRHLAADYQRRLSAFVEAEGLDWGHVQLLTALIFLNMAPLHHYPFDKLLYALGRQHLDLVLNGSAR